MSRIIEKLQSEPATFLFRRMWWYADSRKSVVLSIILLTIAVLVTLTNPLILAHFLNTIQNDGVSDSNIFYLCTVLSAMFFVTLVSQTFHGFGRVLERKNGFLIGKNYREYLVDHILYLKLQWHADRDSGDTIDKVNKATSAISDFSQNIFIVLNIIVKSVGACIALFFFHPYIALGVIAILILVFSVLYAFDRHLIPQYKRLNEYENAISTRVFDGLSNITSVIILRIQKSIFGDISKSIAAPYDLSVENFKLNEYKWVTANLLQRLVVIVPVVFYLFYRLGANLALEVGTIMALIMYLREFSGAFFSFSHHYERVIRNKTDVENVEGIEESFEDISDAVRQIRTLRTFAAHDVHFSYQVEGGDDASVKHLDVAHFSFDAGEKIALIGASGSGKTTFLKILHGLYDTAHGDIEINGRRVSESFGQIDFGTMLVPQEPELFSASVRENITLGTSCSKKVLAQIMEMARCNDFVEDLPSGLESKVHEKGVNLSGGQKQRLALARALLFARGKNVILLDESTSSVDPKNELQIYKSIFAQHKQKTIIASIHKLNLLKCFNRIVIFEKGRIVADGTFDTLLKTNKKFAKSWKEFND